MYVSGPKFIIHSGDITEPSSRSRSRYLAIGIGRSMHVALGDLKF